MGAYDEGLAAATAEREKILAGKCPRCDGDMPGSPDPRQAGITSAEGEWWNHRCKSCDYFCDIIHQRKGLES